MIYKIAPRRDFVSQRERAFLKCLVVVPNIGASQFFEDLAQCVGASREIHQQANIRVFKKIWRVDFIP